MFFNKENEGSMKKIVYLCTLYVRTYAHVRGLLRSTSIKKNGYRQKQEIRLDRRTSKAE